MEMKQIPNWASRNNLATKLYKTSRSATLPTWSCKLCDHSIEKKLIKIFRNKYIDYLLPSFGKFYRIPLSHRSLPAYCFVIYWIILLGSTGLRQLWYWWWFSVFTTTRNFFERMHHFITLGKDFYSWKGETEIFRMFPMDNELGIIFAIKVRRIRKLIL